MDLSPHLSLSEYLATAHRALVEEQARSWRRDSSLWLSARRLAYDGFEPAREVLGVPLHVTSGYRCAALNREVGGRLASRHVLGLAVDVVPIGRDLHVAWEALALAVRGGRLPHVDEAILECGAWIHLQVAEDDKPRRLCLTTDDGIRFTTWTQGVGQSVADEEASACRT